MKKKETKKTGKSAISKTKTLKVKPGLAAIRKRLLTMREEMLKATGRQDIATDVGSATGDSVDEAGQSIERELLFELSDNGRTALDQIEAALRKIDRGIYGACESCRKPISKPRLKTLPFARYCINCQSGAEKTPESSLEQAAEMSASEEVSATTES